MSNPCTSRYYNADRFFFLLSLLSVLCPLETRGKRNELPIFRFEACFRRSTRDLEASGFPKSARDRYVSSSEPSFYLLTARQKSAFLLPPRLVLSFDLAKKSQKKKKLKEERRFFSNVISSYLPLFHRIEYIIEREERKVGEMENRHTNFHGIYTPLSFCSLTILLFPSSFPYSCIPIYLYIFNYTYM